TPCRPRMPLTSLPLFALPTVQEKRGHVPALEFGHLAGKNRATCGLCPHFVVHFVAQGLESSHHGADPAQHFLASTCLCLGQQCPLYTQIHQGMFLVPSIGPRRRLGRKIQCFAVNLQVFVSEHLTRTRVVPTKCATKCLEKGD